MADGKEPTIQDQKPRKKIWLLLLLLAATVLLFLLCGCRSHKPPKIVVVERLVTKTVTERDTVIHTKLVPEYISVTTADSSSHLENSYAESDASIRNGVLHHSLKTKNDSIPVLTKVIHEEVHDSIPYPVEVAGPTVYIEKDLSKWQKFLMWCGGIALLSLALVGTFRAGRSKWAQAILKMLKRQ